MRQTGLSVTLWAIFALAILTGGYAMLRACDLEHLPLFGYASCEAPARIRDLAAEREREADLRSKIHAAEIRLALLPICSKPAPQKPPELKVVLPKPPEPKPPEPKPAENDNPQVAEKFEVPKKIEDLKGCWQSARGDIEIVSDDAAKTPTGTARFCYCFKSDGRGIALMRFNDGDVCRAPLTARINPGQVFMHHGKVPCQRHNPHVGSNITCSRNQSDETTCEIQDLGRNGEKLSEQFIRVSDESCGWNG
jgi:hypothetical protein